MSAAAIIFFVLAVPAARATPRALQFDDRPAPFAPAAARSEAQQDRVAALAHFATGRTYQQRGNFALALRHYARADRLDPAATAPRSALVAFAIQRKRFALAGRYAAKGIDPREVGDEALELLAGYWVKQGDAAKAIDCYEQSLLVARESDPALVPEVADIHVRLELGRLYSLEEKYSKAAEQFARVRDVLDHPDRFGIGEEAAKSLMSAFRPGVLYEMFGEAFLLSGRLDEAEAAFRKSHALAPDEAVLGFNLARVALRRSRVQEALAKLQPYLDRGLSIEGVAPYELLADVLKKLGKESELPARLQKLHAADRANAALSYFLAAWYLKAGKLDLAEPLYNDLLERSPTMAAYQALAEIYRNGRQFDKLLALLGKVTVATGTLETLGAEAKPLSSDAGVFRGLVEAGRKKARSALVKTDYAAFLALGILAQERKQYDTANEFFELALKADAAKAAEILLSWGMGSMMDDRTAEAIKVFQRGIDLKALPNGNPVFQYYLAGALAAGDKLDAALAAARSAVKDKPDSARFAGRVPWILFRARHYEEARAAYEDLLEKFGPQASSTETDYALREARLALSSVCVSLDRLDEAQERLEEVLDEYPDDVEADNDLGFLWADGNEHLQRALKMIVAAVAAEPDNRAYRDSLGWVYYRLGRFPEAVAELEKALDEKRPDATILDHLGDAYQKLGNVEKASAAWRRAKEAYEKDKEPEKAKKVSEKRERTK